MEVDPLLFKCFLRCGGDVLVFDGHDVVLHLDDMHFGSEGVVKVGELHPNGSGTNDHHFLGLLGEGHRFEGRDHHFSVVGQIGQLTGSGPSAHHDFVRGQGSVGGTGTFAGVVLIAGFPHFDLAWCDRGLATGDRGVAIDVFNFVFLKEERNTAVQGSRDLAASSDDFVPFDLNPFGLQSPFCTMRDGVLVELGVVQQCFGGNAAPIQAHATQFAPLNAGDLHSKLGSADGADVAGGSSANDDEIKVVGAHGNPPVGGAILAAECWGQSGELGNHHGDPGW